MVATAKQHESVQRGDLQTTVIVIEGLAHYVDAIKLRLYLVR